MPMTDNLAPAPNFGPGFSRVTAAAGQNIHMYHKHCPWNGDQSKFLYLHYTTAGEPAELRVLELATGAEQTVGTAEHWSHHHAARQMWLPGEDRVIWKKDVRGDDSVYAIADLEGGLETFVTPITITGTHDPNMYIGWLKSQEHDTDRDAAGLMALDPTTREVSLLCSINDALAAHPDGDRIRDLGLIVMQGCIHPRFPLVNFNLSNGSRDGTDKHNSNHFVYDLETGKVTWLGKFAHHPMWHPTEPWIVCFADDEQGRRRLAFDKLEADGTHSREWLPHFSTTGHPSVSPDTRWLLVDDYDRAAATITLTLMNLASRTCRDLVQYPRAAHGQTAVGGLSQRDRFSRQNYGATPVYPTQAHPAWDRTSRYIAFNADPAGNANVYLADLEELDIL